MKKFLFVLSLFILSNVKGQYSFASQPMRLTQSMVTVNETEYQMVQRIIQSKQLHVHPDSVKQGFTICCSDEFKRYEIYGPNGTRVKKGKYNSKTFISTKKWLRGIYRLKVGEYTEVIFVTKSNI
jgi:hypothetical protein